MIFYFSGTGNSEWVAKQIAEGTGDTTVNIIEILRDKKSITDFKANEKIGIVFPIYAWGAPEPVLQFVKMLKTNKENYLFAIATCGDEAGNAMGRLNKSFPLNSCWSVAMPNNYIIMYDVDSAELVKQKIDSAKVKISVICQDIISGRSVQDVSNGSMPFFKSAIINPFFKIYANNTKNFKVEKACTSCGLCEKLCPLGTISMKDGQPVWGKSCTQCLACISHCPVKAIQYGSSTQNKGRYVFIEDK